jgi:hypothetical protein
MKMTVTIIFRNNGHDKGQAFTVKVAPVVHSAYKFLELDLIDGSVLQINMDDIISFQVK